MYINNKRRTNNELWTYLLAVIIELCYVDPTAYAVRIHAHCWIQDLYYNSASFIYFLTKRDFKIFKLMFN